MFRQSVAIGLAVLGVAIATSDGAALGAGGAARVDPASFVRVVDNPWYPLQPGTTYVYVGVENGSPSRDVVAVTSRTKTVMGVRCVVVTDNASIGGRLVERTTDWFAQDRKGNVWYFGEQTAALDGSGRVISTAGSWEAGVDGALPGIVMPKTPKVGQAFRQEYYRGKAEDHFQVLSLAVRVDVPYVSSGHALLTKEWSPLEPGVVEHKYYVRGVGLVKELIVTGSPEQAVLKTFSKG